MNRNIAGTPNMVVTPCLGIASSTAPGSKLRSSTTVAPRMKALSGVTLSPPMWNSGAQTRVTSELWVSMPKAALMLFQSTLPWVSIAPLGRPVVPEVYMIQATWSVETWVSRSVSYWSWRTLSRERTPSRATGQTYSRQGRSARISSTTGAKA